jgi:hypothetical protein
LWGASVVVATDLLLTATHLSGLSKLGRHRILGAVGWVLLASLTFIGLRDLVADIVRLT